jgi:threonine/homoserine/homoserine lactone efflux protein
MTGAEFSALLVLATASSFTPGPNTTLSTALAANFGLRHSMRFVCAVPVGWGLMLALCAAGFGALVLAVPSLRLAILGGGVGYLLWLAWQLARSRRLTSVSSERLNVSFQQGVVLQFLNIKAWMLALAVVAGWIAGRPDAPTRFLQVLPVLLAYAFFSNLTYASMGSLLREWLAKGDRLLMFNRLMATALALTAFWMLLLGLQAPAGATA